VLADGRIFHININCTDLARSRDFYVHGCGLAEGARTTPEAPQAGDAFGLDQAWWDAFILIGAGGFDGGAIDLLEWRLPAQTGRPPLSLADAGFQRVGITATDPAAAMDAAVAAGGSRAADGLVRDPDGVTIEVLPGPDIRLVFVSVACRNLDVSLSFYRSLGFVEIDRVRVGEGTSASRTEVVLDAPGGGEVQLRLSAPDWPVVPATPRPAHAVGMWRLALLVSDLDGIVGPLRAAGIALLSSVQELAMGPGLPALRFVCFRGPDHEVIELIEMPAIA
jgi:catechol 2,3-dioxygenase-like lactoylglutathione lyase family enzyme